MSIYDYHINKNLPNLESRIRDASYSEANKIAILDFENYLFAEGLKPIGIPMYIQCLNSIAQTVKKDFISMNRLDIQEIAASIERSGKAEKTKIHYKVTLKRFFKWLQGEQNAASWIKTSSKRCERKLPEDLLTEAEIKQLIEAAHHPRDKALIAVLYDSGCRIGEIGNLKIKNLSFDQYGGILLVHGKTGARRIRIMFSAPYLSSWLDIHPFKAQQEAFLFVKIKGEEPDTPMAHNNFLQVIKRTGKAAGINKSIHPHLFRHSRATELAQHLTEAQMNVHLGWVPGSGMPGVYVHLSGRDTDDAILSIYGKKKKEDSLPELISVTCYRCKKENGPTSSFCTQCGAPLTPVASMDIQTTKEAVQVVLEEWIRNNPEMLKKMITEKE